MSAGNWCGHHTTGLRVSHQQLLREWAASAAPAALPNPPQGPPNPSPTPAFTADRPRRRAAPKPVFSSRHATHRLHAGTDLAPSSSPSPPDHALPRPVHACNFITPARCVTESSRNETGPTVCAVAAGASAADLT